MNTVTADKIIEVDGKLVTEASDLRLKPGDFPLFLETDLGNRDPFVRQSIGHEVVIYFQKSSSMELHVLND